MPDDVLLGNDHLVIAEVAQAHNGSMEVAHQLIEKAARAGVDAVKFQTHVASAESTLREPWRIKFSDQDRTRFDYWRRMEFSPSQWKELKAHCSDCGVEFMSSPFSPEAIELLADVGVRIWKVASGEVSNHQLLTLMAETKYPVILSSGLSTFDEIRSAASILNLDNDRLAILQCASEYPTSSDHVGLNVLGELMRRFNCVVGISDHSATIFTAIAGAALGARIFEVHIRNDDDDKGPDASSSLTESSLTELVVGVQFVRNAMRHPVDKSQLSESQLQLRKIFGRSLVAAKDLPKGNVVQKNDLAYKKPGGGLPYERANLLVGGRLVRDVKADDIVDVGDVELN